LLTAGYPEDVGAGRQRLYSESAQMNFKDGTALLAQHEKLVSMLKISAELVALAFEGMPGGETMAGKKAMQDYPEVVAAVFAKLSA